MSQPLADLIRPTSLDDIVGQSHLLSKNSPLRRIIESKNIPNMIGQLSSAVAAEVANPHRQSHLHPKEFLHMQSRSKFENPVSRFP